MTRFYLYANAANAWVLVFVLVAGFVSQFLDNAPPCPLCMMQRMGMLLAALGPSFVLFRASKGQLSARDIAAGTGLLILASLLGAAISIRQILLHILPGDPGFGSPVLGYHMYTWALIVFACNLLGAGLQLIGLAGFQPDAYKAPALARWTGLAVAAMLIANVLSVTAEAGFAWKLPDDPTGYLLFHTT